MSHKLSVGEVYSVIRVVLQSGKFATYVLSGLRDKTLKNAIRHATTYGQIYGVVCTRVTYYGGAK